MLVCLANKSSILRALLRFCNLFGVFFVVVVVESSVGEECSRLLANSRLLRLFTSFGIASSATALPFPSTLLFFLDDDDDDDNNESDDRFFTSTTLFFFFSRDLVVGVGLNLTVGSFLSELSILMAKILETLC